MPKNCKNPFCDNTLTKTNNSGGGFGWCPRCNKRRTQYGLLPGNLVPASGGRGAVTLERLFEAVDNNWDRDKFLFRFAVSPLQLERRLQVLNWDYAASQAAQTWVKLISRGT